MKIKQTLLLLFLLSTGTLMAQTVKWFAGVANDVDPDLVVDNSNNIAPSAVHFYEPSGIAWDNNNNMWIAEKNKIRLYYNGQFHNRAGYLGRADQSHEYKNNTGIQAAFFAPRCIASDANGVLFITDEGNHAIRKMGAFVNIGNGQAVTTFAGKNASAVPGDYGVSGPDDGIGYSARFYSPKGIVRDAAGNFYVTDFDNSTIRKIDASGKVTTLAGKAGVEGSIDGNINDGTTARFSGPFGIAILNSSTLVVSDYFNGTIRTVNMSNGGVTTIAGNPAESGVQIDGALKSKARFFFPKGLAVVAGKIYVADRYSVRLIDLSTQLVSLFAGSYGATGNTDGVGSAARFGEVVSLSYNYNVNKTGLFVTDHTYNVIKILNIDNLAPVADFISDKPSNKAVIDVVVTLTNTSSGEPTTSLLWTITSNSLTQTIVTGTATSLTPIGVKFHQAGFYHVNLDVTNFYGSSTKYKGSFISVSTVGISKVSEDVSVGVYPNPTLGEFTLQSLYGSHPIQSFLVTDITGKIIYQKTCNNSMSESFDLRNYQKGFYFVRIVTSAGSNSLKIQKI